MRIDDAGLWFNGFVITRFELPLPPFVATLGA